jgi:hypothetical protein
MVSQNECRAYIPNCPRFMSCSMVDCGYGCIDLLFHVSTGSGIYPRKEY